MTYKPYWLAAVCALALPFVHPFGPVRSSSPVASAPWDDPLAAPLLERACQNCHSEQTRWPVYSYLPLLSWAMEKDVAEARRHLDWSRWDQYSAAQQRDLLARMGSEVRARRMPLPRYAMIHPEARLSDAEIQVLYEWTKAQRRLLRTRRE